MAGYDDRRDDDRVPEQKVRTFPKIAAIIFFVIAIALLLYAIFYYPNGMGG